MREMPCGKWGVFLIQKYCEGDEPVCYGVAKSKETAEHTVERLNNPVYEEKV